MRFWRWRADAPDKTTVFGTLVGRDPVADNPVGLAQSRFGRRLLEDNGFPDRLCNGIIVTEKESDKIEWGCLAVGRSGRADS